jgi:hypothetical protein
VQFTQLGNQPVVINTERIVTAAPVLPDGQGTRIALRSRQSRHLHCCTTRSPPCPQLHRKTPQKSIDDRRFAEAFYRMAVAVGLTAQVRCQDTPPEAG